MIKNKLHETKDEKIDEKNQKFVDINTVDETHKPNIGQVKNLKELVDELDSNLSLKNIDTSFQEDNINKIREKIFQKDSADSGKPPKKVFRGKSRDPKL